MTFKTNVSIPCSCGCEQKVSIDDLGVVPCASHDGQKLFCASHECARSLQGKIEGGQFLDFVDDALNSPEGDARMDEVATLVTGKIPESSSEDDDFDLMGVATAKEMFPQDES